MTSSPRISVIVPCYDGAPRVGRLLEHLARQRLPSACFEVVVVDDGSPRPVETVLASRTFPFALTVLRQPNAGAAAARNLGARHARAPLLVFVDDDMVVPEHFLEAHLRAHEANPGAVVLGRMRGEGHDWGLMERWHQAHLDRMGETLGSGVTPIRGNQMFGGNVSMQAAEFHAAGGFDERLRRGHDAELGLRLEARGARFVFSTEAESVHRADRHLLGWWRARAALYGQLDRRIALAHPEARHASPWRWFQQMSPLAVPFMHLALGAPALAGGIAAVVYRLAELLDRAGLRGVAVRGASLGYIIDYFRSLHAQAGGSRAAYAEVRAYAAQAQVLAGCTRSSFAGGGRTT